MDRSSLDANWISRFVAGFIVHWSDITLDQAAAIGKVMVRDAEFVSLSPEHAAQKRVFDV